MLAVAGALAFPASRTPQSAVVDGTLQSRLRGDARVPPDVKLGLYSRILRCLRPGGVYVEGDYVVDAGEEARSFAAYQEALRAEGAPRPVLRHLDVPVSLATEEALLRKAGFQDFRLIWQEDDAAVYAAQSPRKRRPVRR